MTDEESISIKESIFIETVEEAIRATQEWRLTRLISWDNDLRPTVAKTLIDSVSAFNVKIPELWYDMTLNPAKYNAIHDEEFSDEEEEDSDVGLDYIPRPTEEAEQEILNSAV